MTEAGAGSVTLRYAEPDEQAAPDTDVALLASGFATVTALSPVCEQHEPTLLELVAGGDLAEDRPTDAVSRRG